MRKINNPKFVSEQKCFSCRDKFLEEIREFYDEF